MLLVLKSPLFLALGSVMVCANALCTSCSQGACKLEKTLSISAKRYPPLLVFVSNSMPLEALKALAKQVNTVGGSLVFRGLAGGNFKAMALKLKELGQEAVIDPTLFEAYEVTCVPTFVLRSESTEEANTHVPYDRLFGNISLIHVLEQVSKEGEMKKTAQALLTKLRGKS